MYAMRLTKKKKKYIETKQNTEKKKENAWDR